MGERYRSGDRTQEHTLSPVYCTPAASFPSQAVAGCLLKMLPSPKPANRLSDEF